MKTKPLLERKRALVTLLVAAGCCQAALPSSLTSDYVRTHARPLAGLGRFPDPVVQELAPYRAIMLGELHGTREAPRLALQIVQAIGAAGRPAWLGLEIPVAEQPALDRFHQTGDVDILKAMPFFNRPYAIQDGRESRSMAELLLLAQKLPTLAIYALDPGAVAVPQDRDILMAQAIARHLAERPGSVAVTLTGNVHASMQPGTAWDPGFRPMGYEVGRVLGGPQVLSIDLAYADGTAWNHQVLADGTPSVGFHQLTTAEPLYARSVPWGAYFLKLPQLVNGFGAILFWRTLSGSAPFVPPPAPLPTPTPPQPKPAAKATR